MATLDGKQIATCISCWSGNPSYCWIQNLEKNNFIMGDIGVHSIDILLAMAIRDLLIKQGVIPADIMK